MKLLLWSVAIVAVQSFQFSTHLHHHQQNANSKLFMTNALRQDGEELRPKLMKEDCEQPFSGPRQTPDWTPEKLDEEGRKRGDILQAKEGKFTKDKYESLTIEGSMQRYSIFAVAFIAFASSDASSNSLELLNLGILSNIMQFVVFKLVIIQAVASILCGAVFAPMKNRSRFVWGVKGLVGGPLAIIQLNKLDELMTLDEVE